MLKSHSYLTPFPSEGNYILTRLDDEDVKIEDVRVAVEKYGILLRYFKQPAKQNFLRVTVGLPENTDVLAEALAKVRLKSFCRRDVDSNAVLIRYQFLLMLFIRGAI